MADGHRPMTLLCLERRQIMVAVGRLVDTLPPRSRLRSACGEVTSPPAHVDGCVR